jgi:hypothetical protein
VRRPEVVDARGTYQMRKAHAAIAVVTVSAGCAARLSDPGAPNVAQPPPSTESIELGAAEVAEIDIEDINRMRCDPVMRAGTRIVIGERCYPVGRRTIDEEALAEQLEQVRRDQEELDRRRREAEGRRGPGL